MKNFLKLSILWWIMIFWGIVSYTFSQSVSSKNLSNNGVPDYYYANYKFVDDWSAMTDWFVKARAKISVKQEISTSEFAELAEHFDKVFPHLTKDYASTYEKCSLLAKSLANSYSYSEVEALMWNSCYKSLNKAMSKINSAYTVKPKVSTNPGWWMAPLTVTFDARNSSDPSMETIPVDNFYWYYRDENWVDRPIWQWQVLSYTFEESGKFIVHMTVRSSNVDEWILDGETDMTINVTPKAADIVVYANTRRMSNIAPLKIWISEWEKWIVFDGSLTMPRWWRKIESHRWTITNTSAWFSYDSRYKDWAPSYINVPLKWSWIFKVTLTTIDNQGNTVSESYYIYLSDPVSVIKQKPEEGTTSSTFYFDWSASYSINNRLNTYVWEVFDWNWDEGNGKKIDMQQGKTMSINFGNKRLRPGNYIVRLTVTDMAWEQNVETKNIYVESTTPTPQFTATATNKRVYPSEFTLDASNTIDIDVSNGVDSLEYKRYFSTRNAKIISSEDNNQKVVIQFDEKWKHIVRLVVTDAYWKSASVSKYIEVKSTLRPDIQLNPGPITWWKTLEMSSTVNREVWDYAWNFWDESDIINSEKATNAQHTYWKRWIYTVRLTVRDRDGDINTVSEKAFIWEIDQPIAAYRITNSKWFYVQDSDVCRIEDGLWNYSKESAYSVDRYEKININPSISVNTKWSTNWLQYVFEKEAIAWTSQPRASNQLSATFSEIGCHYIDLTVKDPNVWKQDKVRIWFNVKNALPTIKNVTLTFPQYENNNTDVFWFTTDANSNKSIFDCTWTSNLTIKVTAVGAGDSDWNISRLRFYYYNIDDPDRILEYKESRISAPYVYFVIPKIAWEYRFGVMVYDNDGWMINSDDYLASNPSVYFPSQCGDADVPMVTLKENHTNIQVWDEVTYTVISKISTDNEDFATDRTFYYDFTWDGVWDLVTKKDTATFIFEEPYEDWVTPRAAVEYRWKLWQTEWATILVKNWIKPNLLYNSIWNTVIFRDLSVWVMQQRQICFEQSECEAWNTKYRRTHIAPMNPNELTWWTETPITKTDSFLWNYEDNWTHHVSIYFKNKYWIEVEKDYEIKTPSDKSNWRIAPGVNMITIPETTLTNENPEIFLSKGMKNTLLMYINDDSWETCYVDTDISTDSNWDGKTDNDTDIVCNKIAKIVYEPNYDKAIWRVYFTNDWKLTFRNFYVTFEWYILELDEEQLEIYNDITTLVNGIEDISIENTDLKSSLDRLRKNINNRPEVSSLVVQIHEQIEEWWIKIDLKQKEMLDSVLSRLSNEDTIISVWMNEYEKNREEIYALLPFKWYNIKSVAESMFDDFDENLYKYWKEERAGVLENIWNTIVDDGKKNKWMFNESDFTPYFCNIFDYYGITNYTSKCWSNMETIIKNNFNEWKNDSSSEWWFPMWLKIVLIVLIWWLLTMGWIIIFFSIKAKLNSSSEEEEE